MSGWQYFTDKELTCQCGCGKRLMDGTFMAILVSMRRELDFPLQVTSGYRCPKHNANESSTGTTGPHTTGRAVDIKISHDKAYKLLESALRHGMTGIGVKQKGDSRFIHIDNLEVNRPRVWSY